MLKRSLGAEFNHKFREELRKKESEFESKKSAFEEDFKKRARSLFS